MTNDKPVTLQINPSGSWRNVCAFNAADANASALIMDAAATIAAHSYGTPCLRVVRMDNGYATPLTHWTIGAGWKDWNGEARP